MGLYLIKMEENLLKNKQYKNNQLKEVICEFRFMPDKRWDSTLPGIFYTKIQDEFLKKKEIKELEFIISTSSTGNQY